MRKSFRIIVVAFFAVIVALPSTYAAKNSKNLYATAAAKLKANNAQGAISDYTVAIDRNPKDTYAYLHRGIAKGTINDSQGAVADYTKTIELDPRNSLAYSNRGIEKEQQGDVAGAIAD